MGEGIAVIGAGLAGLVVAERLRRAGCAVTVFEKSRGLGGRLATRRSDFGQFDHGAPVLHCERSFAQRLVAEGACATWGGSGHVGLPGMSGLVRPLARGIDVLLGVEIARVAARNGGVEIVDTDGGTHRFGRAVLAVPSPQAARMTAGDPDAAETVRRVAMRPVWTLMAAFSDRPDLPDMMRPGGALSMVLRDSGKPGRTGETWVAHAAHGWTEERLDERHEDVLPDLLAELDDLAEGRLPQPLHVGAHRWRHALTDRPLGRPFAEAFGGRVLIGGDWTLGNRGEHAFLSGQAIADRILA